MNNFVKLALENGGTIKPLLTDSQDLFGFFYHKLKIWFILVLKGGNFVFPLFVENIFKPTWRDDETWINKKCRNEILEWWFYTSFDSSSRRTKGTINY